MNHKELASKGWSEEELVHARKVFVHANNEWPHTTNKHWLLLTLGVLGVITLALYLTPLLLLLPAVGAYPLVVLVGFVFSRVLTEAFRGFHTEHHDIKNHHHLSVHILLPITAVVSLATILLFARVYQETLPLVFSQTHNVFVLSILFAIGVAIPYLHYNSPKRIKKSK